MKTSRLFSYLKCYYLVALIFCFINGSKVVAETPSNLERDFPKRLSLQNLDWNSDQKGDLFLELFSENPSAAMDTLPSKKRMNPLVFSYRDVWSRRFVQVKDRERQRICRYSRPGEFCVDRAASSPIAGIDAQNQLGRFFRDSDSLVLSLKEMNEKKLETGTVKVQPWSGDYWPLYRASIGFRYADPERPYATRFSELKKYYGKYWPLKTNSASYMENLAPSEKYDLFLGDNLMTLTDYAWKDAESYVVKDEIETWFGLCHGWAAAAFMVPRPTKVVEVRQMGSEVPLTFYPDDIKALATALWANAGSSTYFLGGRCQDKSPKKDENGRILSAECFDSNPGAWHLVIVNQIGRDQKSFVMDATYDYEVWNQPLVSYSYRYFDPRDKKPVDSFEKALIEVGTFSKDLFSKYRSPLAKYIVGITMDVTYVIENSASHRKTDQPKNDFLNTVRYYYDLELDSQYRIIGGEWYQNAHPDMLWRPMENAKAEAVSEYLIKSVWNGEGAPPEDWKNAATLGSRRGQPLNGAINLLIEKANR